MSNKVTKSVASEESNVLPKELKRRIDKILSKCRALRQARDRTDAAFLLYLAHIEATEMELLRLCGHGTFAQFLRTYELCEPARLENFKRGVSLVGQEEALRLGSNPVIALAQNHDREKIPQYVKAVDAFAAERGGTYPSLQTSQRILHQVDPRPEVPRVLKHQTEIDRLRAENANLRSQVNRLERENAQLKRALQKKSAGHAASATVS